MTNPQDAAEEAALRMAPQVHHEFREDQKSPPQDAIERVKAEAATGAGVAVVWQEDLAVVLSTMARATAALQLATRMAGNAAFNLAQPGTSYGLQSAIQALRDIEALSTQEAGRG